MLKQPSCKVLYIPEAEQWRKKTREIRDHLTSAGLEGKLSFSLSFQYFGSPGQKECLLLPLFTRFSVEWTHWFPSTCSKEKREKQNHFCLFPLSSNTTVGPGSAGRQPDFELHFPSALWCRFIYASAFWSSSPSPLSASLITRWFLQPVFSRQLGQH